jgi:hypothetical protein
MYLPGRKMSLIEKIIKVENEAVLIRLEKILDPVSGESNATKPSAHDFAGLRSQDDAAKIEETIEKDCGQLAFGAWSGPESAEELAKEIREGRLFNRRIEEI